MSDITVTVVGGSGSNVTATSGSSFEVSASTGAAFNVSTGTVVGPLPQLQIEAGEGISIDPSGGVSTISANFSGLSIPANLADLTDVALGNVTNGQVLAYNGTAWTAAADNALTLSTSAGADLGTAAIGTSGEAARADHVHNLPTFAEITNGTATVTGNLTLNASTGSVTINGGTSGSASLTLNCEQNTHGVTIQIPPHSAAATYTLTLPTSGGAANQVLQTDGSGSLSWADQSAGGGGITWATEPAASNSTGNAGEIAYGSGFFYLHDGTEWRRAALSTFGTSTPTITITTQPQDLTLADGGSGNFTIAATVSDGSTPSYQWQNSDDSGATWDTLTGSTGTTYSLSGVSTLDNGTQYRAIVSASGASDVTSSVATLTVTAAAATYDLLAENGDRLMTEAGDSLDHDGTTTGPDPSGNWEEVSPELNLLGRKYAYSPDSDTAYLLVETTSSGGFGVIGIQKYERDAQNGTWSSASNAKSTGHNALESVDSIAASKDGSRVIVSNDNANPTDDADYDYAGFTVYEEQNGTLAIAYSGTQTIFSQVGISGDGSVFAAYDYSNGFLRVYDSSGIIGSAFSSSYQTQSLTLNNDGTRFAFSDYADVTGDGNADSFSRAYLWTGSSWVQIGSDFISPANVLSGQPRQPLAFNNAGTRIAVGYSTATGNFTESGIVRVYDWDGSAWQQVGGDISGEAAYDLFGSAVALSESGSRLVVGARDHDSAADNAGRSYIYEWSGSTWAAVGDPIDGDATTNVYFGDTAYISSDGTRVAASAAGANNGNGTLSVYELNVT